MGDAPTVFVGVDLTDSYARAPRPVDVAILDGKNLRVRFDAFAWPTLNAAITRQEATALLQRWIPEGGVVVVDGPQGLARPPENSRAAERALRTPGRTPYQMPKSFAVPFAGYLRGSVEFFAALTAGQPPVFRLVDLDGIDVARANLFEAFPGAAWPVLAACRIAGKGTRAGRDVRATILADCGLVLPGGPHSHDQLDAAACALLGWLQTHEPGRVALHGDPVCRDPGGVLREGRILNPSSPAPNWPRNGYGETSVHPTSPPRSRPGGTSSAGPARIAPCDWVYFATRERAGQDETYEMAVNNGIVARTIWKWVQAKKGPYWQGIPNVAPLRPGQSVLLAYGADNRYRPLARLRIDTPDKAVDGFPAICVLDDPVLVKGLADNGYSKDPRLKVYTAICVDIDEDLQHVGWVFQRPGGNNSIFAWGNVPGLREHSIQ